MYFEDFFKKTLRLPEPYGGWGNQHNYRFHTDIKWANNDTGFCNRLFHWELAYIMNSKLDFDFNIMLQYKMWPELDLLDLPYTFADYSDIRNENDLFWNWDYENLKFKTVFNLKENSVKLADRIDNDLLEEMFNSGVFTKLRKSNHWYSDFGWKTMTKIHTDWYNGPRPISEIKLKHKKLEDILKKGLNDAVGIHLRRFNGVNFKEEDYDKVPKGLQPLLRKINSKKSVVDTPYPFVDDSKYFEIIDEILKINPRQSFFISTDLPIKFLQPYVKRYGHRINHVHHFEKEFQTYLYNCNLDVHKISKYGNVLQNVIDLFGLSYCPFVIGASQSTWSEFAYYYKPKFHCHNEFELEEVVRLFKDYYFNKDTRII